MAEVRSDGAASAEAKPRAISSLLEYCRGAKEEDEVNLFGLCRVATEEDEIKEEDLSS